MDKVEFGFPFKVFFELFAGEHPSDKIYSVQVKDWNILFKDRAAVEMNSTPVGDIDGAKHIAVKPTADLIDFFSYKGIQLPDKLYVVKSAFDWSEDVDEPEVPVKKNSNKSKILLAAIVAALSFIK